jgi:hypothetical protein
LSQALVGGDELSASAATSQPLIRESDLDQPSHRDDAVQVSTSIFSEAYRAPTFAPPPPPPRRSSTSDDTRLPDDYQGIDMLLAQSLSELNDITTFPSQPQGLGQSEEAQPAVSPPAEVEPTEGRRKSLFGWGR